MFTTAHLTSGLAVGLALGLDGAPLAAFVGASVLTDWDYAFQLLTGRNHRTFLTHCPPVVAATLALLAAWQPIFWFVLGGALLHFSLDVWDYGLRMNPFARDVTGFRLLKGVDGPFPEYVRAYFSDRRFLVAEIVLAALAIVAVLVRLAAR